MPVAEKRKEVDECRELLKAHTRAEEAGMMTLEWLAHIALASPGTSYRAMERSFSDCNAVDTKLVSRMTVDRVHGAMVECIKEWKNQDLGSV